MSSESVRLDDLRKWLSAGEAGDTLAFSGTWIKELVRRGDLRGVETSLGWLVDPESVHRLYEKRLTALEEKAKRLKQRTWVPNYGRRAHGRTLKNPNKGYTIEHATEENGAA